MADAPFIAVVSGLPRSGTSMMMQMIEAGGLPVVTDGVRVSDEDNPRGYYELEAVKALKQGGDRSWLERAGGHVVKVIHLLLSDLPAGYAYRVVFMNRDLDEVLASQAAMLERSGKRGAALDPSRLRSVYEGQLVRIKAEVALRENMSLLEVEHRDAVQRPAEVAERVAAFLGGLDAQAMAAAVDPSLYRQRS